MVTEGLLQTEHDHSEIAIEKATYQTPQYDVRLREEISDVVFKLRAFMESSEGELGLGIEMGMQRAADMIETVLDRCVQQQGE